MIQRQIAVHPRLGVYRKCLEKQHIAATVPNRHCATCRAKVLGSTTVNSICPRCRQKTAERSNDVERRRQESLEILRKDKAIEESFMVRPNVHSEWYGLFESYLDVYRILESVYGDVDLVPHSIEIEKRGWLTNELLPAEQLEVDLRRGNVFLPPSSNVTVKAPITTRGKNKRESYEKYKETLCNAR